MNVSQVSIPVQANPVMVYPHNNNLRNQSQLNKRKDFGCF